MSQDKSVSCVAVLVAAAFSFVTATPLSAVEVLKSELVFSGGISAPVFGAAPAGDFGHLYISEQRSAHLLRLDLQTKQLVTVLDLPDPVPGSGTETGLSGFAFHPDFANNGKVYVSLSGNADGDIRILEFTRSATNPDVFDPATEREILRLPNPSYGHNGGWLGFGPHDGYLYLATGDGGFTGPSETWAINAQDVNSLQGKILRLDVDGPDFYPVDESRNYAIPGTNPFAAGGGAPEVFAVGLRHPYRDAFDRETGDLYIGDVGANRFEEIDFLPAGTNGGQNYGWRALEGFEDSPYWPDPPPANAINPIYAFSHNGTYSAVIGGYVYRGNNIPWLTGEYFFGDFIKRTLFSLHYDGNEVSHFVNRTQELVSPLGSYGGIASFAEDAAGELYMLDYQRGDIYRIASRNFVSTDFDGTGIPNGLEQSSLNTPATFDGSTATFPGIGSAGRSYLRTTDDDLHTTSFTAEVTVTLSSAGESGSGFFGLGVGDPHSGFSNEPRTGAHVFMRVDPSGLGSNVLLVDNGSEVDPTTNNEGGDGTHRLRINYDASTKRVQFVIGDFSNGRFVPSATFNAINTSDIGFDGTNARLFFGGGDGITFDDLSHRYLEGFDSLWTGTTDFGYGTATNWSPQAVPNGTTNLYFTDTAANFTVDLGGDRTANSMTFSGLSGFTLDGGTLSLNTGGVTVVGGATHTVNSNVTILTNGIWDIESVATLDLHGNLSDSGGFQIEKTGAGTLILAGNNGSLASGLFNGGTVHVCAGATFSTGRVAVAGIAGSDVAMVIRDGGTIWNATDLVVGDAGTASLTVEDGASVMAEHAIVGNAANAIGVLNVIGPETTLATSDITLGSNGGSGTLTIQSGGSVSTNTLSMSNQSAININGGTLRLSTYSRQAGSVFNYLAGAIQLAGNRTVETDPIVVALFGATPTVGVGKTLRVEGMATISATTPVILAGGTLAADTLLMLPGSHLSSTESSHIMGATLVLAGSLIDATAGNLEVGDSTKVNGFYSNGTIMVGPHLVTLADSNDAAFDSATLVTFGNAGSPGALNAANGLTLDFGGNFIGYGTVSTPNNPTAPLINNGHITGNSVSQPITLTGYVKGVGTFDNVNFTGTLAPGLSPTSITVGNVAFASMSTLVMEFGGTTAGNGYDQIQSSGVLEFDGTLQASLINGFTPAAGQSFNLFDWVSTSGAFHTVQLPMLVGLAWNTSQLYTDGILSVVAAGLPGDYNHDVVVDAADYVVWRNGLGTTYTQSDYDVWRSNFSQTAASGAGISRNAAIPEPATQAMLLMGILAAYARRRTLVASSQAFSRTPINPPFAEQGSLFAPTVAEHRHAA